MLLTTGTTPRALTHRRPRPMPTTAPTLFDTNVTLSGRDLLSRLTLFEAHGLQIQPVSPSYMAESWCADAVWHDLRRGGRRVRLRTAYEDWAGCTALPRHSRGDLHASRIMGHSIFRAFRGRRFRLQTLLDLAEEEARRVRILWERTRIKTALTRTATCAVSSALKQKAFLDRIRPSRSAYTRCGACGTVCGGRCRREDEARRARLF